MIHCIFLINRQGKIRLTKWYESFSLADRAKLSREVTNNNYLI